MNSLGIPMIKTEKKASTAAIILRGVDYSRAVIYQTAPANNLHYQITELDWAQ